MADYYDSNPGQSPAPQDQTGEPSKPDEGGKTALIPSDLCPGMKAGEEVVLHIDRVLDGQYQVSYAPEPQEEEASEQEGQPASMPMAGGNPGGGMYD